MPASQEQAGSPAGHQAEEREGLVDAKQQQEQQEANGGVDVSSVITQVTQVVPPAGAPKAALETAAAARPAGAPGSGSWGARVRRLLCCFSPGAHRYEHQAADQDAEALPAPPAAPFIPTPPRIFAEPVIGPVPKDAEGLKTLVLDLDETLVHSSFKPIPNPDYIIPVEIEGRLVDVYVLKRPWMDHFMQAIAGRFEVIVFTASLSKYADPLLDLMDPQHIVHWRLFRESCCPYEGNYVKDLTCLGRDLAKTIIVDNSPHSYVFQPYNALPIGTFIDDMEDQELLDMVPVLQRLEGVGDVREVLGANLYKLLQGQ
jgi:RNA polymerase II subunit A small phosphatase-like protein